MENEDKNQEEKKQPAQSMWKELWDYAKIIIVVLYILMREYHQDPWNRRS